jgi:large subunit ribosomal protein L53
MWTIKAQDTSKQQSSFVLELEEAAALMLLTKYLSAVHASFSPFARNSSKSTRVFLALLLKESARQANPTKVTTTLLPPSSGARPKDQSKEPSGGLLKVTYKDGKVLDVDCSGKLIDSVVEMVNAHSKTLQLKEQTS